MDLFVGFVSILIILLALGIMRNWKMKDVKQNSFSILIACRNEEQNLPLLFEHLQKLDYPADKYELIIADDASTDDSAELIERFCADKANATAVLLKAKCNEYKGKKAALKSAAESADHEFLLFTDADCFPAPLWIAHFNEHICPRTGMIVGSYYELKASGFQNFCNQASAAIFAGTIGLGLPFSGAGGNLCIRKAAFEEAGGYEKIRQNTAGDDKQMVNLIAKTRWQIAYNAYSDIATLNSSSASFQRNKRKFGKLNSSAPHFKLLLLIIFAFYLYLPLKLIIDRDLLSAAVYLAALLCLWTMNLIKHKFRFSILHLPYLIFYPYFVIFFAILGSSRGWQWKDLPEAKY